MANYYAFIRTNYFSVTDETKFREIIASCQCEDSIEIFEPEGDSRKFGFGCYGSIYGIPPANTEDSELDEDINLFFEQLQTILPEGEAILFTEIGYEKLRYLVGYTSIITKDTIDGVDLRNAAFKKAGEMLGVENYTTEDQY